MKETLVAYPHIEGIGKMGTTIDTDFRLIEALAALLELDDTLPLPVTSGESSLARMLRLPFSEQESKAKQLLAGWCAAKGLDVVASGSSDFDRYVYGYRAEIKFSTLCKNGTYVFQQVRDQPYDLAICLGLSPFDAQCWVVTKHILKQQVIGHTGQHGGQAATDTAWFRVDPNSPPLWIVRCGGRLRIAYKVLKDMGPGPYISRHS